MPLGKRLLLSFVLCLVGSLSCIAQTAVGQGAPADAFAVLPIDEALFARMQQGGSFPPACTVPRTSLRYLRVLYYNYFDEVCYGELVCHESIAVDLLAIFEELFRQRYPINSIALIDDYDASDALSMAANNTSAFCYRTVANSKTLSKHAQGLAIDINPLDNPCVTFAANGDVKTVEPDTPAARTNATQRTGQHAITRDDLCYKLFTQYGFTWGGAWKSKKDYQHFQR